MGTWVYELHDDRPRSEALAPRVYRTLPQALAARRQAERAHPEAEWSLVRLDRADSTVLITQGLAETDEPSRAEQQLVAAIVARTPQLDRSRERAARRADVAAAARSDAAKRAWATRRARAAQARWA